MDDSLTIYSAKSIDADSTVMPKSRSWLRQMADELGTCEADHGIVVILNCPAVGIISASKWEFFVSYISNVLSDNKGNSIAVIIHPNRASQHDPRTQVAKLVSSTNI